MFRANRLGHGPIIHPGLSLRIGTNINGPSLIRRPHWLEGEGRYMLYFGHHHGDHIRLATADAVTGPWAIYEPGVLPLHSTPFAQTAPVLPQPDWAAALGVDGLIPHLSSPDVQVNETEKRLEMILHGLCDDGEQRSLWACSRNGIDWVIEGEETDSTYLRCFVHQGTKYAMAIGGQLMRETTANVYEKGPFPIPEAIRHVGLLPERDHLHVFYTCFGHAPERIFHVTLDMSGDWQGWQSMHPPNELLRPELEWEGADLPLVPSVMGATEFANALRDPFVFEEGNRLYLIYAGGGEAGLGVAELLRV